MHSSASELALRGEVVWCRTWCMALQKQPPLQDLLDSLKADFRIYELELPNSPIFVAVAMPLDPATTGLHPRLPAGRGLSAAQAMLSAAAESVELLASLAQNCDRRRNQFKLQDSCAFVLAENLCGGPDEFLAAQRVYLDWASVAAEPLVYDADSNGCASGINRDDALNRAILEVIERDAMAIWWYARQRRRHVPVTCLDRLAPRLSWWLGKRQRRIMLIDITSDVGVPAMAAVSHEDNGGRVAIGSAADSDFEAATISAVTEMIQMEVSMTMGPPSVELENWFAKASVYNMPQFHPNLDVSPKTYGVVDPLQQLGAAGHKVFAVDMTRAEDLQTTVRVIVPALSALHRKPDLDRIISQSKQQPQYGGVRSFAEIEMLNPY